MGARSAAERVVLHGQRLGVLFQRVHGLGMSMCWRAASRSRRRRGRRRPTPALRAGCPETSLALMAPCSVVRCWSRWSLRSQIATLKNRPSLLRRNMKSAGKHRGCARSAPRAAESPRLRERRARHRDHPLAARRGDAQRDALHCRRPSGHDKAKPGRFAGSSEQGPHDACSSHVSIVYALALHRCHTCGLSHLRFEERPEALARP
jgi:hypothetical protein